MPVGPGEIWRFGLEVEVSRWLDCGRSTCSRISDLRDPGHSFKPWRGEMAVTCYEANDGLTSTQKPRGHAVGK